MKLDVFGGFVVLEKSSYLSLICEQQLSIVHWNTQEDLLVINRRKNLEMHGHRIMQVINNS